MVLQILVKINHIIIYLNSNKYFNVLNFSLLILECETKSSDIPCIRTGSEVLASYDFDAANLWPDVIKIFLIYFFLLFIAYLALLKRLTHRKV